MNPTLFEFPNGFRFVHQTPSNNLPITSIQCICDLGSVYETDSTRGASHFIEHMCFKGTTHIPVSQDIFKKYDEIGAYFNAFTVKRYTCYYIKCHDDYIIHCLHILSDLLLNSAFNKKEYEKELQVVIQENYRTNDRPMDIVSDAMEGMLYAGSSYSDPVDSLRYHVPEKKGKTFAYSDIVNMYRQFYRPPNLILSVVSNISFPKLKHVLAKSYFTRPQRDERCGAFFQKSMNLMLSPQSTLQCQVHKKRGAETNILAIAFRTCSQHHEDKYALNLLKTIVGSVHNSKLMVLLREKNGLTYSSYASTNYYEHMGDFTMTAVTDPTKLLRNGSKKGVLPLIIDMINTLVQTGITESDFKIAKQFLRGKMNLSLEDNDNPALYNAECVLFADSSSPLVPFQNLFDVHYKDLKWEDVNRVLKKYFRKSNMNVCLLGGEHVIRESILQRECEKLVAL